MAKSPEFMITTKQFSNIHTLDVHGFPSEIGEHFVPVHLLHCSKQIGPKIDFDDLQSVPTRFGDAVLLDPFVPDKMKDPHIADVEVTAKVILGFFEKDKTVKIDIPDENMRHFPPELLEHMPNGIKSMVESELLGGESHTGVYA